MTQPLWTFADFVAAMNGRPTGLEPGVISGISIDSRTTAPGDAFFAIRGDQFDGHDFVGSAAAHGASVAVIAEERLAALGRMTLPLVVVSDVLHALEALGLAARARSMARIVAVTGSVGKTSTKEMLARALAGSGPTHYSPASFNNHWGVPLTLSRLPADARYAVFEIGMNHPGEITPLVGMVRPHVAIVTNIEAVHLQYFEDGIDGIVRAKAEIFSGIEPGGAAILNRDNPHFEKLALLAIDAGVERVLGFGQGAGAEGRLLAVDLQADHSLVTANILGNEISFTIGAPGRHLVQNALAVLLATVELGADIELAATALGAMAAPKGRGARHQIWIDGGQATLIDESYNASPTSMRAAMAVLATTAPAGAGRRIAVLGDMLELGPDTQRLHAELVDPLMQAGVDRVYLAGPSMHALWEVLPAAMQGHYAEKASELELILVEEVAAGDVVMVKGSNGSRMAPLVETLKTRFSPHAERDPGLQGPN
ncbi:UDP-N-acetylmuramoylalanyl-D-glutamyl-2,6-diaminopimelate--D-alanyl-D-alanine ligase [Kaistia dalseonensis]|uniref:UDP-N-acetylmuramoyl-tripeptide--D-alanyl-D-alanine ligase n=1 Tax=Kaistia dalseonensis TaxID=410840 RepID=A0ABU0HBT6_9HYPH|nr:UDP-N-acetylmuramoylalanyl-D-glutamyl-2,6-diaminopimelate--D-alanyl-D-alanine ligase [Kaistia dalseonensis]MCX5497145.1 UDP-N-acetylmuramoylalanyl-D-glutamyl-2,6-diaminopimelate--D-alanyl-D-alanine ligase [Kaistia dalseonensis]MDQ0439772.1 UDP-N-acetylmuramoyl-tripeptide--D-alanyl-D-alanine ligase [Kaistia dalseonensis]